MIRFAGASVVLSGLVVVIAAAAHAEEAAHSGAHGAPDAHAAQVTAPAGAQPAPPPKLEELIPLPPSEGAIVSPFGDPYDPLKPPPPVPQTGGPGITSANLVAAGPANLVEYPLPAGTAPAFFSAVIDVIVAPGSTTDVLGTSSITMTTHDGEEVGLFGACMPTLEDASIIIPGEGTSIAAWTVVIGDKTWRCGGGNARMVRRVGPGGFKLTAPAPAGWTGPMVLLFQGQLEPPQSITLAGRKIELPAAKEEKPN
jgi:hypothetical protein